MQSGIVGKAVKRVRGQREVHSHGEERHPEIYHVGRLGDGEQSSDNL